MRAREHLLGRRWQTHHVRQDARQFVRRVRQGRPDVLIWHPHSPQRRWLSARDTGVRDSSFTYTVVSRVPGVMLTNHAQMHPIKIVFKQAESRELRVGRR
jgi:hypothetical protein